MSFSASVYMFSTGRMLTVLIFFILKTSSALHRFTCPARGVENTKPAFGLSRAQAYLQSGVWHTIPCLTYRPGEKIDGVIWYRGTGIDDQTTVRLISRSSSGDFPTSDRYEFSSSSSLLIKAVEQSDQGSYLCQVIPQRTGYRVHKLELRVIGELFPASPNDTSSTQRFQRGRRQTLPCECASQTPDVAYWSTGEGVTTDTQIIGARFSDGATLQIQHGADFSIGSNSSLTINSLNDLQDTQRFWCHVFRQDGSLQNCFTNCFFSDNQLPSDDPLQASEASFYLWKGRKQILPCLSWTPGDTACEVEWSKMGNPDRQVLSYNLSSGDIDLSPGFDLAIDFGLVINSVVNEHAGVYQCSAGNESHKDIEVRVVGDKFPLDEGRTASGGMFTLEPGTSLELPCLANPCISKTTKATLFWSFGAVDAQTTSVIGSLKLPSGSLTSGLRGNECYNISSEGFLWLNNCTQENVTRYWCHIFLEDGFLLRSYVDVEPEPTKVPECPPSTDGPPDGCARAAIITFLVLSVCVNVVLLGLLVGRRFHCMRQNNYPRGRYAEAQRDDNQSPNSEEMT